MSRVGENIKKVREAAGLSPKALAKKIGVSESFLIDVELGRRVVNEAMIQRFSKVLGRNVSELGLDSFESAVFKEEKEIQRQSRIKEAPRKAEPSAQSAPRNEVWDQAFGSNLKSVPVYGPAFEQAVGQRLYPVENGRIHGLTADKAVLIRQDSNDLAGYGILHGSELLGAPLRDLSQNGFYLIALGNRNVIRKVKLLGNGNVLLLRREDREISETVSQKSVKALLHFVRVETKLL